MANKKQEVVEISFTTLKKFFTDTLTRLQENIQDLKSFIEAPLNIEAVNINPYLSVESVNELLGKKLFSVPDTFDFFVYQKHLETYQAEKLTKSTESYLYFQDTLFYLERWAGLLKTELKYLQEKEHGNNT